MNARRSSDGFLKRHRRQNRRYALRQHGSFPAPRRPDETKCLWPAGAGHFQGARLGGLLPMGPSRKSTELQSAAPRRAICCAIHLHRSERFPANSPRVHGFAAATSAQTRPTPLHRRCFFRIRFSKTASRAFSPNSPAHRTHAPHPSDRLAQEKKHHLCPVCLPKKKLSLATHQPQRPWGRSNPNPSFRTSAGRQELNRHAPCP